ncbi:hypothetical protein GCM10009760_16870 [Kitasatospora kazusensis]|uniref:Uncharacterized protein n=1 Tax=Kitasatospora kazusensis TaxID=407974 RepID=A0ABP5KW12_9ACTN
MGEFGGKVESFVEIVELDVRDVAGGWALHGWLLRCWLDETVAGPAELPGPGGRGDVELTEEDWAASGWPSDGLDFGAVWSDADDADSAALVQGVQGLVDLTFSHLLLHRQTPSGRHQESHDVHQMAPGVGGVRSGSVLVISVMLRSPGVPGDGR